MVQTITKSAIIQSVPYSKGILEHIRKRMDNEDYNILLCETNGLYHKEYWMCKNQEVVNDFLDTYESNSLWYISDEKQKIKLSIDFDWKDIDNIDEGKKLFQNIKNDFEKNIIGIADRTGNNKYSKRIYTNLSFQNTLSLKYYMKEYISKKKYKNDVVDISIYTKNRLYPIVSKNIKGDRELKWVGEGNYELCNPNNTILGEEVKCAIPTNVILRKKHAKINIQEKIEELNKKEIDTKLFLELLNIIPNEHWDNYNEWLKLATFCKCYFDFKLFHNISCLGDSYDSIESCQRCYDGIKVQINAGFVVNTAKQYNKEKVNSIYQRNKLNKDTLTEKLIAKQCCYYFGTFFRKVGKSIFYFDKVLNTWREYKKRDFIHFIDEELDLFILPLFKNEDGDKNHKLVARYHSMLSTGINKVIDFFGEYIEEINESDFNKYHNDKLFFTNGYYDFNDKKFIKDKSPDWYNKNVINIPYVDFIDINKKNKLEKYFEEIFKTNLDDFEIFKNLISCALTGKHQKHLLVLTESGNNAKSSLLGLLTHTFNTYGCSMGDSELLTQSLSTSKPRADIQNIISKRIITMLEPDENIKLNTSAVKQITGGDKLCARGYFQKEPLQFRNHGLIVVGANTMPQMTKVDKAIANRLICIPMKSKFVSKTDYEKYGDQENIFLGNDYFLTDKFYEDYSTTCLQLIIEWANKYRDVDIVLTDSIKEKTNEYLNDSGIIDWIETTYETTTEDVYVKLTDMYELYKCNSNDKVGKHEFLKTIRDHPKYSDNYKKTIKRNNKLTKSVLYGFRKLEYDFDSDSDSE